ncbi:DUF222 domain-containing protein [Geodermatophilus sp. SYSU D00815]
MSDAAEGVFVDEMSAALDALADDDLHGRGPALLDDTRQLLAVRNRLDAEIARRVRTAENQQAFAHDGARTAQSWLRGHCLLSKAAASQVVRNGRALELLPAVAAGHAAGRLTADQVAVIGQIAAPRHLRLIAEQDGDMVGIARELANFAVGHKHAELDDLVHAFLERLDADGPEPDPTGQRSLTLSKRADGRLFFRGELDAVGGERFQAAIESIAQAHRSAGDERSVGQRQADALVQLADIHLSCGTPPLLLDPATGPASAQLGCGGVLSAARARWAARDADLTRIVLGPDGEPLDLGHGPAAGARAERARRGGQRGPSIRRLRRPAPVVLGPPPPPPGARRGDVTGEQRAAPRTAPHPGPPRLPRRTRHRRPLAHLPPDGTEIHVIRPPADDPALARAG